MLGLQLTLILTPMQGMHGSDFVCSLETSQPFTPAPSCQATSSPAVVSSDIAENAVKAQQNQNEVDETQKVAEKAKVSFKCEICDFESTWENGLKIHMNRKHSKIEQVDGCQDINFEDLEKRDTRYDETDHYWRSGRIGIAYHAFLDAISVIEESDLPMDLKEKEKILEARKSVFGDKFCDFPPCRKV